MTERERKKDRENKGKMKKLCRPALIGFIMFTLSACGSSAGGDDKEIQMVEAEALEEAGTRAEEGTEELPESGHPEEQKEDTPDMELSAY